MRLVAGAVAFALFAPIAAADDTSSESTRPTAPASAPGPAAATGKAPRGKVPLRVVRVMPESHQALLFDSRRSTHVLAEVGGQVAGYTVDDIDGDTVTLHRGRQQIVLAAPARLAPRATAAASPAGPRGPGPRGPGSPDTAPPGDSAVPRVRAASTAGAAASEAALPSDPAGSSVRSASAAGPVSAQAGPASSAPAAADPAPAAADPAPLDPYAAAADGDPAVRSVEAPDAASAAPAGAASASPGSSSAGAEPGIRVSHAPSAPSAASAVVPGEDGVRVASAPEAAPAASSDTAAAPVRVVEAPGAAASPAAAPSASPDAPSPPAPAAAAPTPIAAASIPASAPSTPGAAPAAAPGSPAIPDVRAADTARAADKQTLDARALADVLTTDPRARGPHDREVPSGPTRAAEVRAAPAAGAAAGAPISRSELDGALADFAALTAALRGSFSANGVVVESVGDGTIFQRAGLRAGDVIASVDGVALRSLDDAANLYARAATARAVTAEVVRGGKPVTLRVVIR